MTLASTPYAGSPLGAGTVHQSIQDLTGRRIFTLDTRRRVFTLDFKPAPRPFSPLDLSPVLWFDAADIATLYQDSLFALPVTADNDPVGGWKDKSGSGKHVIQATSIKKPGYKANRQKGLSSVKFDGANDFLTNTSISRNVPFTTILCARVGNSRGFAGGSYFFSGGNDKWPNLVASFFETLRMWEGTFKNGPDLDIGDNIIFAGRWFHGLSDNFLAEVNGAFESFGTSTVDKALGPEITFGHWGTAGGAGGELDCDIFEYLEFPGELEPWEIAQVRDYLNDKWGVF